MRRVNALIAFFYAVMLPASASAQTVGSRLNSIVTEVWNPFFLLVAVGSALLGLFFFIRGLLKLVEAAQGGSRNGFGGGLTHIVVAAFLIALPDAAGIGMTSVLGAARGGATLGSGELDYKDSGMSGNFLDRIVGSVGGLGTSTPTNCLTAERPATCMAANIAQHAIPMAVMALFAMVFILGLLAFAAAIVNIAKSSEQGGGNSKGHITKLVTAILLMNAPLAFNMASTTVLGNIDSTISENGMNTGSTLLTYPVGSGMDVVKNYTELIGHSFTILVFFGAWAFVRGVFMIKGVAEGGQQKGSYGMAATYIIAGILMANSKISTCMILTTFGGADMGAGFCS